MELRHLRYFIAVAEEHSFRRAAERLGIRQPPLSLQIRHLEREMSTPLFHRRTRGVELTDAGRLLLEEGRSILHRLDRAKSDVARRGRGESGELNIGSSVGAYYHPLIPTIIREYGARHPDVELVVEDSNTALLLARLRAGAIDLALVRPPFECDGLRTLPLVDEGCAMVLPIAHPLAGRASAPLSAFAGETFILFPRAINPGAHDMIVAACRHAGFEPILGQPAPQVISSIPMVAAGLGVSIVPLSMSRIAADGAFFLPIEGGDLRAEVWLAYCRNERSPAVRKFVDVARREVRRAAERQGETRDKISAHDAGPPDPQPIAAGPISSARVRSGRSRR
jgi:DNA-binding transcriptional LysR family regulator